MISYNPQNIVKDTPVYTYYSARPQIDYDSGEQLVNIHHGDVAAIEVNGQLRRFLFGSVIGYALEQASDPFAAVERAEKNGHELHWANQMAVVLTSHKQEKQNIPVLELGQMVKMEGKVFELVKANNDNVTLVQHAA